MEPQQTLSPLTHWALKGQTKKRWNIDFSIVRHKGQELCWIIFFFKSLLRVFNLFKIANQKINLDLGIEALFQTHLSQLTLRPDEAISWYTSWMTKERRCIHWDSLDVTAQSFLIIQLAVAGGWREASLPLWCRPHEPTEPTKTPLSYWCAKRFCQ